MILRLCNLQTHVAKMTEQQNWVTVTKCWCVLDQDTQENSNEQHVYSMNHVIDNQS